MRICILGESAREGYLAEDARMKGWKVNGPSPWDLVVLPLPRGEVPIKMADQLPSGQKIVCGMISESMKALAKEKGWQLLPVLNDPVFTQENAVLTAEGAIYYAMRQADFSLHHASCAVIGYGRIGKALTQMLRGLGANVTVAARREESRKEAGENSVSTHQLDQILPHARLIFNTVPALLVDGPLLSQVSKDAYLLELASPPYGINLPAAQEMGLRAWQESGIPGRYCPQSAADALMAYIERSTQNG